jgi:peptidoglycan hydrolase-like protein with peptidoglycan-binding domain
MNPSRFLSLNLLAACGLAYSMAPAQASLQTAPPASTSPREAHIPPRPFSAPASLAQPLRFKMTSPQVRELQIRLRHARYLATYDANNQFGAATRTAVEKLQRENDLPVTGVVDQKTWDVLRAGSFDPTAAELNNTDIGPWFTGPHAGYIMERRTACGRPAPTPAPSTAS